MANQESLPLYEVLEEEYIKLHGSLPPRYDPDEKDPKNRLTNLYKDIHNLQEKRSALCISGGGIRSATFGLGIIQGLARRNLLQQFDYLSTVSGGGYLGSWLSAWIDRHNHGLTGVAEDLGAPLSRQVSPQSELKSPVEPEPEPISNLRSYSNYLSPRLGILSADTWTLAAIFFRNLLLNWLVLIPLMAAVLMIPRICVAAIQLFPKLEYTRTLGLWISFGLGSICCIIAIVYMGLNRPSADRAKEEQEQGQGQGRFLRLCLLPLLLSAIFLTSYWAWLRQPLCEDAKIKAAEAIEESRKPPSPSEGKQASLSFPVKIEGKDVNLSVPANVEGQDSSDATESQELADKTKKINTEKMNYQLTHVLGINLHHSFWTFLIFGVGLYLVGYFIYSLWLRKSYLLSLKLYFGELGLILSTGVIGSWLVWLAATKLFPCPTMKSEFYVCFAAPLFLILFLLTVTLFAGISSKWTEDQDREWWARMGAWILIVSAAWVVISVIVIFGPAVLWQLPEIVGPIGGISGLISILLGRNSSTSANNKQKEKAGLLSILMDKAVLLAAPLFAVFIAVIISALSSWLIWWLADKLGMNVDWHFGGRQFPQLNDGPFGHLKIVFHSPLWLLIIVTLVLAVLGVVMAWFINTNKFSLHAMYRNRLIRAYLGASRNAHKRKPNLFTGFDENDNIQMHELWPNEDNTKPANMGRRKLLHVVNMALNLVSGDDLAWQERMAASFTATPLHCGNYQMGYRKSKEYGGKKNSRNGACHGMSLGAAVTISGAAASPNMGYHSSPVVTFLLTLFNVRLGAWLGNPGKPGEETYYRPYPRSPLRPIVEEAFGLTNKENPYVYLSDGGHFENLGLYEMVLRRCHFIVVSDGSQDVGYSFEDLGNAVRKIRIDFGIPIEFEKEFSIFARSEDITQNNKGRRCAIGKIRYSCVDGTKPEDDGLLIYIKPAFYGNEPRDIYQYASAIMDFPHESTADQFYSESQFESYRMLGSHTMDLIFKNWTGNGFDSLIKHIEGIYLESARY